VDPCSSPRASSEPDRDEDASDGTATMTTTAGATVRWIASSTSASRRVDEWNESMCVMERVRQHVGID